MVEATLAKTTEYLNTKLEKLKRDGFEHHQALKVELGEAAVVWGIYQGIETPRIMVMVLPEGKWELATADQIQQFSWNYMPSETPSDQFPRFAFVADEKGNSALFDIAVQPFQIDQLPAIQEINEYGRLKADPTYRWSLNMYEKLMSGFNLFHEQVYQTVKDRVSDKNDIIEEVTKFLFLESFRLNHDPSTLMFEYENTKYNLNDIYNTAYVKKHGKIAIDIIQAAFDHLKSHQDYVVTDDKGESHPIFDEQTHLRLAQPRNYETLLSLLQELGPVKDNNGRVVKQEGSLKDIAADVLGRVFDVFLRANFESKGGLGVYLTPNPVKQAMLSIAFHDLVQETPELLTARGEDGAPLFRYCDPACGSYGFGAVALGHVERALQDILGKETASDVRREKLFQDICKHSFVGADAAPRMVRLARVNMALLGAPQAKIFYTQNSLSSEQLKPNSFDLICTNPPFGTPKFNKNQAAAKKAYTEDMNRILEMYRSDLSPNQGRGGGFTYHPTISGLAMGGQPNNKGIWKEASSTSIDPAVLFIDRCLQLLKPGGRLLIVLPDGVLCNSGDRYVREYIMGKKDEVTHEFHGGKAIVKAVISLPGDTFKLSGTGAKTSILYLQKRKAAEDGVHFVNEPQGDVFMAVAETLGYVIKNNIEDYSTGVSNDLAAITGAYVRGA